MSINYAGDADFSTLVQTFNYVFKGFPGFLSWHLLLPLHNMILSGLAGQIKKAAEKTTTKSQDTRYNVTP